MDIKNVSDNSNKNLQLVSTFGERNQHKYLDLLEFKYKVDNEILSIREIFEEIFTSSKDIKDLKATLQRAFANINTVQKLVGESIDLMDKRLLTMQEQLNELEDKFNLLK